MRHLTMVASLAFLLAVTGCGDKIEIPEAVGLFSVNEYYHFEDHQGLGVRQLCLANNLVFTVSEDGRLTKRYQNFEEIAATDALADPVAVAASEDEEIVFVWEAGAERLSAWSTADLLPLGDTVIPGLGAVGHLAAAVAGAAPEAETFVYLSDADSLVVHRYAWTPEGGAVPAAILCHGRGGSARSVRLPAGMAVDPEGMMLVCDADSSRHWVNRFDPSPDPDDLATGDLTFDPFRGTAVVFAPDGCSPPATAAYTLGDAPTCGQVGWEGGPGDADGHFDGPADVAVDGSGRIFVADRGNARFQVFGSDGSYELQYDTAARVADPVGIAVADKKTGQTSYNRGAYVFIVDGAAGDVHVFISSDEYARINTGQPPPPN